MKNKNLLKYKVRWLIVSLAVLFSLSACSGEGKGSHTSNETDADGTFGTVYVPEYQSLEDYPDRMDQLVIYEDTLYGTWRTIDPEIHESVCAVARWDLTTLEKEEFSYRISGGTVSKMAVAADGGITLLVNGSGDNRSGYYIVSLDEKGDAVAEWPLGELLEGYSDGTVYSTFPRALAVDSDGNMYLSIGFSEQVILVLDSQGNKKFDLTDSDEIVDLVTGQDGIVYARTVDSGGVGYALKPIIADQGIFGEGHTGIPGNISAMYAEDETHFLISCGDTLYRYDVTAQASEVILNWINADIDSNNLQGFAMLEDGRIFAVVSTVNVSAASIQNDIVFLTETEASQVSQKTVVTYGVWGDLSRQMRQQILSFNKTNGEYRIEVRDYLDGEGYGYLDQGMTTFHSDLAAGNGPDLMDLTWLDFSNYADKGVFADLNMFLKKDGAISREDLAEGPLGIYERDGRLYGIPLFFSVSTLVGRTETLQGLTGWTVEDIRRILAEQPEETAFLGSGSRDDLLNLLVAYQLDRFIDWEEGTCSFDSQEFIDLLAFVADCPFADDLSEVYAGSYFKIHEGKVLVTRANISTVVDYQFTLALYDGEDVTFIGYPTADGSSGSVMEGVQPVAILDSSHKKEGAWEFVKTLLSEDYQKEMGYYYFPVRQSVLEECMEEAMTENTAHHAGIVWDDFEYDQVPATQEQIDGVKALIELAKPMSTVIDSTVTGIISEETAGFFAGQKTADAVAKIIQSRVSIYVNENEGRSR